MGSDYQVVWTNEALLNLDAALQYLKENWTEREILNFKKKLASKIHLISRFPFIFPASEYQPRLRKAVLSKQTSILYEVNSLTRTVTLIYLFDNRQHPEKIK